MSEKEQKNLAEKIVSFVPGHGSFVDDDGQTVEYDYFVVELIVNGEPYKFNVKTKNFADKLALFGVADTVR